MSNTGVPCNECSGKGEKINHIKGNTIDCLPCEGTGMVFPCTNFSSNMSAVFRNRKCNMCNATENQHVLIGVK